MEDLLVNSSYMADVRATASKYPELKNAVVDNMQQPITLISALFVQLTLKGELFDVYTGASDTGVEQHKDVLDDLIEGRPVSKKELMQKRRMQEIFDNHVLERHCSFCIIKCAGIARPFHKPRRLFKAIAEDLKFLPDPVLDQGATHYKPFSEVYGKHNRKTPPTTERNQQRSTSAPVQPECPNSR